MPTVEILSPWSNTVATNNTTGMPPNPFHMDGTYSLAFGEYRVSCRYRTSGAMPGPWSSDVLASRYDDGTWTCDLSTFVNGGVTYDFQASVDEMVDGMWVHRDEDTVYGVTIQSNPPILPPPPPPPPGFRDKKDKAATAHPVPRVAGRYNTTKGDDVMLTVYRVTRKHGDKKSETLLEPLAVYHTSRSSDGTWEIYPNGTVPVRPGSNDKKLFVMDIVLTQNGRVAAHTTWVVRAS